MKTFVKTLLGQVDGREIHSYTFETEAGYRFETMNYGAVILEYVTPDREGRFANINLRFDAFEDYLVKGPKFGATVGPVAGRIAHGEFELNGQTYRLPQNNATNNMHSGLDGYHVAVFDVVAVDDHSVTYYTERAAGSGGFPGLLKTWVTHHLAEDGTISLTYRAESDADTLFNPTNHAYFNLSGDKTQTIDTFELKVNTLGYYPVSEVGIPAAQPEITADFYGALRDGVRLEAILQSEHPQIVQVNHGLDHPFVIDPSADSPIEYYDPASGRLLTMATSCDHVILYTANNYNDFTKSKGHPSHNGLALEAQFIPDAIHRSSKEAAQVILRAGQPIEITTSYRVRVRG